MDKQQPLKSFSIVFIPTWLCNSKCLYCFEKISDKSIKDHSFKTYFEKLKEIAISKEFDKLTIFWQGGEVFTLGVAVVQKGLCICTDVFRNSDIVVEHRLQSNLLLYTSEWKGLIQEYFNKSISSSLDFPNLYRKTATLSLKEYNQTWLMKKKEAKNDGFSVNAITLPNKESLKIGAARFYDYFYKVAKVKNLQVNFPFPGTCHDYQERLDPLELADFMEDLYDLWVSSGRPIHLAPFSSLERRIHKDYGSLPCIWSYSCANSLLVVGPDGEVGQCDCWVSAHKEFNFGFLTEDGPEKLFNSKNRKQFLSRPLKMIQDSKCGTCEFWKICFGGCPVRSFAFSGNINTRDYYCETYKKIFSFVLKKGR